MNDKIYPTFALLATLYTGATLAAVDESSRAYQTGHLVGKIFGVILIFLIIKKIFFKKK